MFNSSANRTGRPIKRSIVVENAFGCGKIFTCREPHAEAVEPFASHLTLVQLCSTRKALDLKCKRFEANREEEAEQTLERQTARKILFWTSNLGQL
jgi:hypothetical protein